MTRPDSMSGPTEKADKTAHFLGLVFAGRRSQTLYQRAPHNSAIGQRANLSNVLRLGDAKADGEWQIRVSPHSFDKPGEAGR